MGKMRHAIIWLFEKFCSFLLKKHCKLSIQGKENLPSTSFVLCSNHSSHLDSPALMLAAGKPFKNFCMVAATDYFFKKFYRRPLLLLMNLIPINRESSAKSFLECVETCKKQTLKGKSIIIYPEGTRSTDGDISDFKKGAAFIAAKIGIPIVPAYIKGTFEASPKGTKWIQAVQINVSFGKPISSEKPSAILTEELKQAVHQLKKTIK